MEGDLRGKLQVANETVSNLRRVELDFIQYKADNKDVTSDVRVATENLQRQFEEEIPRIEVEGARKWSETSKLDVSQIFIT